MADTNGTCHAAASVALAAAAPAASESSRGDSSSGAAVAGESQSQPTSDKGIPLQPPQLTLASESSHKRKGGPAESTNDDDDQPEDAAAAAATLTRKRRKGESGPAGAQRSQVAYWRPTGWSQLPLDLLEVATSFLPLSSFAVASRISCGWRSTCGEVRGRADIVTVQHLIAVVDSSLSRHVVSIFVRRRVESDEPEDEAEFVSLSHAELKLLQVCMPRLRSQTCAIDCTAEPRDQRRQFPARLRKLDVTLRLKDDTTLDAPRAWALVEHAMKDIARVSTLTSLSISIECYLEDVWMSPANMPVAVIRPLLDLRKMLTCLALSYPDDDEEEHHQGHTDVIRQLSHLSTLSLCRGAYSSLELELLTADPAPPNLTFIDLDRMHFAADRAESIGRLAGLINFSPHALETPDPSFLSQLIRLRLARLNCLAEVDIPLLIAALAHCPLIHTLVLGHAEMTDDQLANLLGVLPAIRHLTLEDMKSLNGLSFASKVPHLAATVESLTLRMCEAISPAALYHLRAFGSLRQLAIDRSLSEPLDANTLASFTPSSQACDRYRWPHLSTFKHIARKREAVQGNPQP